MDKTRGKTVLDKRSGTTWWERCGGFTGQVTCIATETWKQRGRERRLWERTRTAPDRNRRPNVKKTADDEEMDDTEDAPPGDDVQPR